LPIDIGPANAEVFRCDFLSVEIDIDTVYDDQKILSLKREGFDVVIFCLLLEYLPLAGQRLQCIQKAIELLEVNGLLCIVTPDSSHMGKNSLQMKSWKHGLNLHGLRQVSYEKTRHFHGLVFRKPSKIIQELVIEESIAKSVNCDLQDLFFIPQDSSTCVEEEKEIINMIEDRCSIRDDFSELPCI